jgi:hypothetical protein
MARYRCSNTECRRYEEFLDPEIVVALDGFGGALYHSTDQGSLLDPVVGRSNVVRIGSAKAVDFPLPCGPVLAIEGPCRIRLRRIKGWRKPEGAVVCTRPGRWGNPLPCDGSTVDRDRVAGWFAAGLLLRREGILPPDSVLWTYPTDVAIEEALRGKDLCCFCPLDNPCHVDALLVVANR